MSFVARGSGVACRPSSGQACPSSVLKPSKRAVTTRASNDVIQGSRPGIGMSRRHLALLGMVPVLLGGEPSQAADMQIESEAEGFGKREAQPGDLLLVHYVGTIAETGAVFDSTRGGLKYRDGGAGVDRPTVIRLSSDPVPGVVRGLKKGLEGMRVGGRRTITVPPELGFGERMVGAPYAFVPPNSTLKYEVELIRLSARGPDELTKGIAKCGAGGASEMAEMCQQIEPMEFF